MNLALIFAGGTGRRFSLADNTPKQFLEFNGKAIIVEVLEHFQSHPQIDAICIVCLSSHIDHLNKLITKYNLNKVNWIIPGGNTGQESIYNGLQSLSSDPKVPDDSTVLIHDGVRPFIDHELISANIKSVAQFGSGITVAPVIETVTLLDSEECIDSVVERNNCWHAKAPQSFILSEILAVHKLALAQNYTAPIDSAALMKHYGKRLHVVHGNSNNIKITTPIDFYMYKAIKAAELDNALSHESNT